MKNKFYVTTPIYYVNAAPHLGSAYTTIAADVLARYYRLEYGRENVFFMTGTDEHGAKIQEIAEAAGKTPKAFTDEIVKDFKETWDSLNIDYDMFIRTTDRKHEEGVAWVTQKLYEQGDIYKGTYEALYCVGCEQYKTKSELMDGNICPDHNRECEIHEEEAYLFALSKYGNEIEQKIESDEIKIRPLSRKNEILSFIKSEGLNDVAVSRKKENVSWGVDLPFDTNHTTYVWVDAFLNYLTGFGWPESKDASNKFWPADVQLMAKDILRVHATLWQAMLIALGLPTSKELFVHGYFTVNGKKMSKSLGNVLVPQDLVSSFGADAIRYAVLREFPFGSDGDISEDKIKSRYNSDLANDLGNLVNRIVVMLSKYGQKASDKSELISLKAEFANLRFDLALEKIWDVVRQSNAYIDSEKPWELAKFDSEKLGVVLEKLSVNLNSIAVALAPFMPTTSEKIIKQLQTLKAEPLFPRIEG